MQPTPLSLRIEPRSLPALRGLGMEHARIGKYSADNPDCPPRINPTQQYGNYVVHGVSGEKVYEKVADAVESIGLARVTGRQDQNVCAEIVMSVDGAWAEKKEAEDNGWKNKFILRCKELLIKEYGAENVISITAHGDERAPHIHAIILPVTEVKYKNKYKSGTKRKISYASVFAPGGRDAYAARWARDGSTAETTYAGQLQTRMAAAMTDLGIVRGAYGSAMHRRHMSRNDFYDVIAGMHNAVAASLPQPPAVPATMLEQVAAEAREKFSRLTSPPADVAQAAFQGGWQHGWQAAMVAVRRSPVIAMAAMAEVDRRRRHEADAAAAAAARRARKAACEVDKMHEDLKSLRDRLRTIQANDLNQWIGDNYPLEVKVEGRKRKIQNAYDRLLYIGIPDGNNGYQRLNYTQATEWLAEHFSDTNVIAQTAGAYITQETKIKADNWLKKRILSEVEKVYKALGVKTLRILAIKPKEKGMKKNESSGLKLTATGSSEGDPMTFAEFSNNISLFMAKNAEGYGIYAQARKVDEIGDGIDVLMIDDVEHPADAKYAARGPEDVKSFLDESDPNIYMRTSEHKTQALYAIPMIAGDKDHKIRNEAMRRLNAKYGDPAIGSGKSGQIVHVFRLPGFLNKKKSADNYPVSIIRTPRAGASHWAQERIRDIAQAQQQRRQQATEESVAPALN